METYRFHKILFVCSANKDRSATAEQYFSEKYPTLEFDAAGTNKKICFQLGTCYISVDQLIWADAIFVMEKKHKSYIQTNFKMILGKNIIVLNIPDHFTYFQPELIQMLEEKVNNQLHLC